MNKAEIMERFVAKAGFADGPQSSEMVRRYRTSPEGKSLTFGEWAVMTNALTPDQVRTIQDFFDNSRFQCLECGANVYGKEFEDRLVMTCPYCGSREFQLRGTARAAEGTQRVSHTSRAPGAPAPPGATSSDPSQSLSDRIDQADMAKTQSISRAPKLPGSGEAHEGIRVVSKDEGNRKPAEDLGQQRRRVSLEALQILKGRSIDEFLQNLHRYALPEWSAALSVISGLNRRDLVPAALEDGRRRLEDLSLLSLLTRSMPRLASTIQAFIFELVQETATALAGLGAFLASQELELERPLAILRSATGGARLAAAQEQVRQRAAGDVTNLLDFFLRERSTLRTLSALQTQYHALPEDPAAKLHEFLESPEPFIRALVAYGAADPHSPIATDVLEARLQDETTPFVASTFQTALDRRQGLEARELSSFEKVLILKRTPLFAGLNRDNLIIHLVTQPISWSMGS